MASLPVELLRLIYDYCDPPTVRNLRRVSRTLASIGYEYLIPPHFTARGLNHDAERLLCIAVHERLRDSIESISFHLSSPDQHSANDLVHIVGKNLLHGQFWLEEKIQGRAALRLDVSATSLVEEALMRLPNVKSVEVVCPKTCWGKDVGSFRRNAALAATDQGHRVDDILSATRHCSLSSLGFLQLPLEFLESRDRHRWYNCTHTFASLSRLDLALDSDTKSFPQARTRAMCGLGRALRLAPALKQLSLSFLPRTAIGSGSPVSFQELLDGFTYENLTDLKLEGIGCDETDLSSFILRHAPTLERLRLGGHGPASLNLRTVQGITLYEGTWRSFFASLRCRLPQLKRFHAEGLLIGALSATGHFRERHFFLAVTDDNWEELPPTESPTGVPRRETNGDSVELERYLLEGGEYPKQLAVPAVSP